MLEAFSGLLSGFAVALTPTNLLIAIVGVVLGMFIGILPGLGAANGVALLIPLTFWLPPSSAIILLAAIYYASMYSGGITSILFNIPGEPFSVATTFDWPPMAIQGRGGDALIATFSGSLFAGIVGVLLITFLLPPLADFALKFGPPEYFAVMCLAFACLAALGRGSIIKTLTSALIGFILATIGLDTVSGKLRITYGSLELMRGFGFLVAVIGLFGIGEIFLSAEKSLVMKYIPAKVRWRDIPPILKELTKHYVVYTRSTLLGFFLGMIPGAGATTASVMSYSVAKRLSRHPEKFGTGVVDGVIACETADNSAGTGALLPMITLGIPTSATVAVMLGGLLIWGLQPGPMLVKERPDFVWGLIASMYTGNLIAVIIAILGVPLFAAIMRVPYTLLMPVIMCLCVIGAYAANNALMDVAFMFGFGVIGYVFRKLEYPLAPFIFALILGDMTESALRQSLIMSHGSVAIFFTRPIAATFMVVALLFFAMPVLQPLVRRWWDRARGQPARVAAE
jgi:putative tricarboxylic transport membrane protein